MTLIEHLAELRDRILKIVVALSLGTIVGYIVFPAVLDVLIKPYCDVPSAFRFEGGDGSCQLLALGALEPFTVRIKTSVVIGLFIGGPIIFFQLWRFVTPGLTSTERRYALPFVIGSQFMFALGLGFAYIAIPQGLAILLNFGGDGIAPALTASQYISFYLSTSLAFGIVFELPLILILLAVVGVVSSKFLRQYRPYALVINTIIAAVVTPSTDAVTLMFMAVPMAIFYEISIIAAIIIERRRRKRRAA